MDRKIDNNIVRTNYESIYAGLIVTITKNKYKIEYRLDNDKITLFGVPGKEVYGSTVFKNNVSLKKFRIFKRNSENNKNFNIIASVKYKPIQIN